MDNIIQNPRVSMLLAIIVITVPSFSCMYN